MTRFATAANGDFDMDSDFIALMGFVLPAILTARGAVGQPGRRLMAPLRGRSPAAAVGQLLNVVRQAIQLPLRAHLRTSAQREAIETCPLRGPGFVDGRVRGLHYSAH